MNKANLAALIIPLLLATALPVAAQEQIYVPFSDPSRPGRVVADILMGGITVEGYDGSDVVIEAAGQDSESRGEAPPRARGLRRIPNLSTGLEVEERNNVMTIESSAMSRVTNVRIRVPFDTSLKLDTVSGGDIVVSDVRGEIEVDNTNGAVRLTNIGGSAIANALNGEVVVTFTSVTPDTPMSFSTLNGEIDVTLPGNVNATIKMKTDNGEIFSDFEIELQSGGTQEVIDESRGDRSRFRIDKTITGTINGGGPEFQLTTFNGNIYIRRGN